VLALLGIGSSCGAALAAAVPHACMHAELATQLILLFLEVASPCVRSDWCLCGLIDAATCQLSAGVTPYTVSVCSSKLAAAALDLGHGHCQACFWLSFGARMTTAACLVCSMIFC
jgi:hypothetical protein